VRRSVERTHVFAEHLADVFQPHPSENEPEEEETLTQLLEASSAIKILRNHRIAVSSPVKFLKKYLLPTYSVLSCSKDTSRCSGKYHRSYSS
jgi:hypothetical protein